MGAWEIAAIVFAVAIVGAVIASGIIRKKKGKPSCCSDCSCCPYHSSCPSNAAHIVKTDSAKSGIDGAK